MNIGVVGFGKIGQAIAASALSVGSKVVGVDKNKTLVRAFTNKDILITEPGLKEQLLPSIDSQQLIVTDNLNELKLCDAVLVSVPLDITEDKSIGWPPFEAAIKEIAGSITKGTVVSIETTIPLGACRSRIQALFEQCGLKHDEDYFLAHSPERIKSGTMLKQLATTPKVVGGLTEKAKEKAFEVYKHVIPEDNLVAVESIEAAEMIKLAGMIYRDMNIAVANEFSKVADAAQLNIHDVIKHANTDGEAYILRPGVGVGGHCTPVYPYFLFNSMDSYGLDKSFFHQGRKINESMPSYYIDQLFSHIEKPKHVLILGLAFRPGVKEPSHSPAFDIAQELDRYSVSSSIHDPLFTGAELTQLGFKGTDDLYKVKADAIILVTEHKEYQDLNFSKLFQAGCKFFLDGRNAINPQSIKKAGIGYINIGLGQVHQ